MDDNKLWYKKAAENWNEALPIGSGALGGMVFGGITKEQVQMNEESLWYGGYRDRNNADARRFLPKIRELLWQGKISEAEKLLGMSMFATPEGESQYSVLGDLVVNFYNQGKEIRGYRRELDLNTALCSIGYETEKAQYERHYFSSYPDKVLVAYFKASEKGALELSAYIERKKHMDHIKMGNGLMRLFGKSGHPDGVDYEFEMEVEQSGGTSEVIGNSVYIKGADEVLIKLTAATSFNHQDPEETCKSRLKQIRGEGYEELLKRHVEDYHKLADRMWLKLEGENFSYLPTDERLERLREGEEDLGLISLYFQYGRYLLISSSREGGLPANLQGLWNKEWQAPWDSKYTININTEMNYWPAEKCNLSECHLPLFEHLERMKPHGVVTAKKMYGCKGWVAHHNTDLWGDTAPQDRWMPGTIWPMGAAWLCLHIWEHYRYTEDLDFLEQKYHLMKEAGEFFKDYLIQDEKGYLVTTPSVSPENTYILPNGESGTVCIGPTMDNEILYELFSAIIKAGKLLGEKDEEINSFKKLRSRLTPLQIGKYGQIMEWREDYEEREPGHRHISHLFGLYPGHQISTVKSPSLTEAAKTTLNRRLEFGGGHTGWSRAWIINLWARLKEGNLAYENILQLLKRSTLNNLLDNHPPFQIDGNFGGIAGISEVLLQEEEGVMEILPALPEAWRAGKVRGLCAAGGIEMDIEWQRYKLIQLTLRSKKDRSCAIKTALKPKFIGEDVKNIREEISSSSKSYIIVLNVSKDYPCQLEFEG